MLLFSLTNRSATYQRYINSILFNYLNNFYIVYLNDILIYLDNELKHEIYIKKILSQLQNAKLQIDIKKTEFHVTCTKYLEFIVTTKDIKVNFEKVAIITF